MNHYYSLTKSGFMLLACILVLSFIMSCGTTIYIVRHGERPPGINTHLDGDGIARAAALEALMADKKITDVLTTDSNRTRETAQPTATRFRLPLTIYGKDTIPGLVAKLKKIWGKNILIVSHSETIPLIVQEFGYTLQSSITGYNRLIILKRVENKPEQNTYQETTYGSNP